MRRRCGCRRERSRRSSVPVSFVLASVISILVHTPLSAQGIRRAGAQVFEKTCASIYCHGSQGAAGAAPAVAGKDLSQEQVSHIIEEGIPETNMAGWKDILSATDLASVIDYVIGLQKLRQSQREQLDPNRPWLNHPGRELFFDPNRITPCGACHQFDGLGLAVTNPFEAAPDFAPAELRNVPSENVRTVRPQNDAPFVGLAAPSRAGLRRWYDLTDDLPILRTFASPPQDSGPARSWTHEHAVKSYSDAELAEALDFLSQALAAATK